MCFSLWLRLNQYVMVFFFCLFLQGIIIKIRCVVIGVNPLHWNQPTWRLHNNMVGFFFSFFFSSFFLLSLSTVLRLCPFSQTIQKSLEGCYRNCIQSDKAAGSRLSTRGRPCIGIAAAGGFHGCWCVCEGQVSPCGLCGLSEGSGLDTVVTGCCSSPEPPTFTDSQLKTRPSFYKRDPPSMSVSIWKDKVETRRSVLEPD